MNKNVKKEGINNCKNKHQITIILNNQIINNVPINISFPSLIFSFFFLNAYYLLILLFISYYTHHKKNVQNFMA